MDDLLELPRFSASEIGICSTWHGNELVERIVYSGYLIMDTLVTEDGMTPEAAMEYIEQEFVLKYAGASQPIIVWAAPTPDSDDDQ